MTKPVEDIEDIYELLPMQLGMLLDSVVAGDTGLYLVQVEYVLHGTLDDAAFEQAWQQTVVRHPVLRTSLHWVGLEKPLQVVHLGVGMPIAREDWSGFGEGDQEQRAAAFLEEDRRRGVDFGEPPLQSLPKPPSVSPIIQPGRHDHADSMSREPSSTPS